MLLFVARAEEKSHTPLEKFWPETASSTFSKFGSTPLSFFECVPVGAESGKTQGRKTRALLESL
jgi:hypothetical protein